MQKNENETLNANILEVLERLDLLQTKGNNFYDQILFSLSQDFNLSQSKRELSQMELLIKQLEEDYEKFSLLSIQVDQINESKSLEEKSKDCVQEIKKTYEEIEALKKKLSLVQSRLLTSHFQ